MTLPAGACDCHAHVLDPAAAPVNPPAYPLPAAPAAAHRAMLDRIGVARGVLVQPSAYGADHGVLADAIARSDGRLRGVGLLDRGADEATFDALDAAGVRALRFVEARIPGTGERYPGNIPAADLPPLADAMQARGWHAELWAPLAEAADLCDAQAGRGVPIVLDHLAGATETTAPDDADFRRILRHVERGDVWVKLVLCRVAPTLDQAMAVRPLHEALIAANPTRLVWGTDYPFIRKGENAPDPARLLDLLIEWSGAHADTILAANPAALHRFPASKD